MLRFLNWQKFVISSFERCQSNLNRAYLEVTRLVSLADDKEKQSQAFRLMELALEEQLRLSRSQQLLEKLSLARRMWKANVSFQNALEYMVLSLSKVSVRMNKKELFDALDGFSQNLLVTLAEVEAIKKNLKQVIEENTALRLENDKLRERLGED